MPACPRSDVVCAGEVAVYHCWSRCVRRAFLCGQDPLTGQDYEYRREWIRDFEESLAGLFGIEVGFHAEMSNHIHLVLRTRPDVVESWSDEEVARRWLVITHLTNREDQCRGHFWQDRYKCRQLADEGAILVCGIYVDLNQIRAGEAFTPEASIHTSACDRIRSRMRQLPAEVPGQGHPVEPNNLPAGWLAVRTDDRRKPKSRRRRGDSRRDVAAGLGQGDPADHAGRLLGPVGRNRSNGARRQARRDPARIRADSGASGRSALRLGPTREELPRLVRAHRRCFGEGRAASPPGGTPVVSRPVSWRGSVCLAANPTSGQLNRRLTPAFSRN